MSNTPKDNENTAEKFADTLTKAQCIALLDEHGMACNHAEDVFWLRRQVAEDIASGAIKTPRCPRSAKA